MNTGLFFLSWTPVVLPTVLAVVLRRSALELSIYGFLFALALALSVFRTPVAVGLLASVDGIVTTLPLGIGISFAVGLVLWLFI